MPLTVASALARLGGDPWLEAERLARLPRAAATEALATMIARVFPARGSQCDAPGIAASLILLLPSGGSRSSAVETGPADPPSGWPNTLVLLICLALLVLASFNMLVDRMPAPDAPHAVSVPLTP